MMAGRSCPSCMARRQRTGAPKCTTNSISAPHSAARQNILNLHVDQCGLAVIQDTRYKYVHFEALPPLFFDLDADPGQFYNRACDPAYAPRVLEYAQKMLSWRLHLRTGRSRATALRQRGCSIGALGRSLWWS